MQKNFFAQGQFGPEMLPWAYKHGQPVTVGELLTIGRTLYGTSVMIGPVMVNTGERDPPFCGRDYFVTGDRNLASIADTSKNHSRRASEVNVKIVQKGGHALNMEYGHEQVYHAMNEFLLDNGL
jgi:hypothetical protein